MKILIIDNYDSFTYNLVHLVGQFTQNIHIYRNDQITLDSIRRLKADRIIISPGPGRPENAQICIPLIRELGNETPILGVCLGHQAIGITYGAQIGHAAALMHGKVSKIQHNQTGIYQDIPQSFQAGRYHSLVIERNSLPGTLHITAETEDGTIMGVSHSEYPVTGIQFHPESVLTEYGSLLIKNWLDMYYD